MKEQQKYTGDKEYSGQQKNDDIFLRKTNKTKEEINQKKLLKKKK